MGKAIIYIKIQYKSHGGFLFLLGILILGTLKVLKRKSRGLFTNTKTSWAYLQILQTLGGAIQKAHSLIPCVQENTLLARCQMGPKFFPSNFLASRLRFWGSFHQDRNSKQWFTLTKHIFCSLILWEHINIHMTSCKTHP